MKYLTDEEIKERYANCYVTFLHTNGARKKYLNGELASEYEAEMDRRNMVIPSNSEVNDIGVIDGVGTH